MDREGALDCIRELFGRGVRLVMLQGSSCPSKSEVAQQACREMVEAGMFGRFKSIEDNLKDTNTIPLHLRMDRWTNKRRCEEEEDRILLLCDNVDAILAGGLGMHLLRILKEESAPMLMVSLHPDPWPGVGRRLKQMFSSLVPKEQCVILSYSDGVAKRKRQQQQRSHRKVGYDDIRAYLDLQFLATSVEGEKLLMNEFEPNEEIEFYDSSTALIQDIIGTIVSIKEPIAP